MTVETLCPDDQGSKEPSGVRDNFASSKEGAAVKGEKKPKSRDECRTDLVTIMRLVFRSK